MMRDVRTVAVLWYTVRKMEHYTFSRCEDSYIYPANSLNNLILGRPLLLYYVCMAVCMSVCPSFFLSFCLFVAPAVSGSAEMTSIKKVSSVPCTQCFFDKTSLIIDKTIEE